VKKVPNWIIIILLIGLLIASKFIFFSKKDDKAGANKNKAAGLISANFFVVKEQSLLNGISVIGKTGAFNQVNILPEVSGKIVAIYFKDGETVNKGTLLVKLNDADLQAQALKIKSQIKLSEKKLNRLKQLLQAKGISEEEYESQENELNVFKAEEAVNLAQIAKTNIVAPFNGVLGLKQVSEGAFVSANTPIVSLVQLSPLYIEFALPEKYSQLISKGKKVNFKVDENADLYDLSATVFAIEPMIDEATKAIKVRALYNSEQAFYPGAFVYVQLNLTDATKAKMVPTQCIVPTLKGQKIYLYKGEQAIETPVSIGVRNEQFIQITEGVEIGDTVLTTGIQGIKKDSKIKLLKLTK
jgi:membrane fusion protein (multidrug efflux system)